MIIKLVRHGLSQANTREVDGTKIGDHNVELTETGKRQAVLAGDRLLQEDPHFFDQNVRDPTGRQESGTLIYTSPYTRTRQTLTGIVSVVPAWLKTYEDPRLREVEWGYNKPKDYGDIVDAMQGIHGKFFFRMEGGESPADGYDRISGFIATLMRQIERKNSKKVLIVSHGLTIRCFAMRFMHLSVEDFEDMTNPKHCDIITITNKLDMNPQGGQHLAQFRTGKWHIRGLRLPNDPGPPRWPMDCGACSQEDIVWPNLSTGKACCDLCGETTCL